MEWKDIAQYVWVLFVTVFGFMLKAGSNKLNALDKDKLDKHDYEIDRHEFRDDMRQLSIRVREDVKDLHKKIESGQKENREQLGKILDKLS